jgi:hypothetical protein
MKILDRALSARPANPPTVIRIVDDVSDTGGCTAPARGVRA